jgi:hypothetical protein
VTSPARTVLDIAPRLTAKQLTRLVNDARLNHHLRIDALEDVLSRERLLGRPAREAQRLRDILEL